VRPAALGIRGRPVRPIEDDDVAVTPNASGRPNRVAPDGSTHAVADRGRVWGNRGRLLNARRDHRAARREPG